MVLTVQLDESRPAGLHQHLGKEDGYWLLGCALCNQLLLLCNPCHRHNRYCRQCAPIARAESKRRARLRYQKRPKGREQHRLGQQRYRHRRQAIKASSVCSEDGTAADQSAAQLEPAMPNVMDHCVPQEATMAAAAENRTVQSAQELLTTGQLQTIQCDFCGAHCVPFAYRKSLRQRRRRKKRLLRLRC